MNTEENNSDSDKQIDPFEWMDRNSHILDEDLLEFIKLSPHENLGVLPPQDPRVLAFPCPNMVETFNASLVYYKQKIENSSEPEHGKFFEQIIYEAASSCGVIWSKRFRKFLIQKWR